LRQVINLEDQSFTVKTIKTKLLTIVQGLVYGIEKCRKNFCWWL